MLIDISYCGKSRFFDEIKIDPRGGRIATFRSKSCENFLVKKPERRHKIPNYLECEESKMIERIITHGFQDFTGHYDMANKVSDLIYNWALEVIIIEDGETVLKAMTLFFRMAINIMIRAQYERLNLDNPEQMCRRLCGIDFLEILAMSFGGS
jgi:hypothetical protein